ncbi:MAG: hypothetical protein AB1515_07580 [Nitrospirota bacterium]
MYPAYSSFEILVSLLFGAIIGQFGYGAGVLLIAAAAVLWGGDALQVWINTGGAVFLVRTFVMTGLVAIATHVGIALYRKHGKSEQSRN